MRVKALTLSLALLALAGCAGPPLRGTGDLGVVVERSAGRLALIETSTGSLLDRIEGLGDLSHASVVFSRDERFAFVFGRDGGLTKVDLLERRIAKRVVQAGNSIGGAIGQDGSWVAVANYEPGGVKIFDSATLDLLADIPAIGADGKRSKVVGIAEAGEGRLVYSLYDAGEIWLADLSDPRQPKLSKFPNAGKLPYDGLVTMDGRSYIAGLFGEDGLALLDLWNVEAGVKKVMPGYGKGAEPLPVFKMPHLRGWAAAGDALYIPAIGRHEVLVIDRRNWTEIGRIPVAGQPVFVMARPDGRQVWVNFALPHNDTVQVIDTPTNRVIRTLKPGKAILHLEFTPKGDRVWLSARDDDRVTIWDTKTLSPIGSLAVEKPSGIFFTVRAHRFGL
ncbi:MAG: protein nirF [Rhodospirillales bacterium]|nr:protein nirF [Rhodospirillales bacterium]